VTIVERTRAPITRLLRGQDCWWLVSGKRIARLPLEAIEAEELVPEARETLDE